MNLAHTCARLVAGCTLLGSTLVHAASPAPGSLVINSANPVGDGSGDLLLQGRVALPEAVSSLDINGYPAASFDGEVFTLQLPASENYQVNLYTAAGGYESLQYAAPTQAVDSAVQVVVGNQLAADVGPALGALLTDLDLNSLLGIGSNTCVVDTGWLIGCDLYIKSLAIEGTPDIELAFVPGNGEQLTIDIDVAIPQAVVSTKIKRAFWWGYRKSTITTQDIQVGFQIGVEAAANQSIKLVLDEPSDVQLSIGRMQVSSNTLAAHLVPLFKDIIADVVNQHVANVAGPFLSHLPIPAIPLGLQMDIDGDGTNDADFAIKLNAELLDVLANGDGVAALGGSISAAAVAPGREIIGTRRVGTTLPLADELTAPTDLSANLSVDLVNQVLGAVYQSGIEEKLVLPLTVADLGNFGLALQAFGYNLDDPLNIHLSFNAVPEMLVNNTSLHPLGLEMAIPSLNLRMGIPRPEGEEIIMDMDADVVVATSLGAEGDGSLLLDFNDLLALENTVINGGTLSALLPPEVMAATIGIALPQILNDFEPVVAELLNAARLELNIGHMLGDWLDAEFPSVPVSAYVTETGVSDDEAYLELGAAIDFP